MIRQPVCISFDIEILKELDQVRGLVRRTAFLEYLIQEYTKNHKELGFGGRIPESQKTLSSCMVSKEGVLLQ